MFSPKFARRKGLPVDLPRLNVLVFHLEDTFSPRLHSDLARAGANLMEISVSVLRCTDRELLRERIVGATKDVEEIDVVLAFADFFGTESALSSTSIAVSHQTFAANVLSVKTLFDELFKTDKRVVQACVLTVNPKAIVERYPSFGVAEAGLEAMVKLYAVERPKTHFSILCASMPGIIRRAAGDIAATIEHVASMPTGIVVDEYGTPLTAEEKSRATLKCPGITPQILLPRSMPVGT